MRPRTVSVASSILVASLGWTLLWVLVGKEDKRPDLSRQLHQTPFRGLCWALSCLLFQILSNMGRALMANPAGLVAKSTPRVWPTLLPSTATPEELLP